MKRKLFSILTIVALMLSVVPFNAFAAGTISVDDISSKTPGSNVTISGTTTLSEVNIKVIRPDNTILYIDVAAVNGGSYTNTFTLPSDAATGSYTVVAGQGSIVDSTTFSVSSGSTPGPGPTPQPQPELTTVNLSGTAPSPFNVGDTYLLSKFTVSGKDQSGNNFDISGSSKTWNSSDSSIAAVTGDSLEAMGAGTASITVTIDGVQSNAITVIVSAPAELSSIELSGTPPSPFRIGDTYLLSNFTVSGKDQEGNDFDISDSTRTWNSSDSSIAAVSGESLEAVGAGTAAITVTVDGIESNALTVIVSSAEAELTTLVLEGTAPSPFYIGDTFALSNFTLKGYDQNEEAIAIDDMDVDWNSTNNSVLAINAGNIEAVAEGTADISATINGIQSNTITVVVGSSQANISAITISAAGKTPVNGVLYLRQGDTLTVDLTLENSGNLNGLSVAIGNWKTLTETDFVQQADKQYRWTYTVSGTDQMRATTASAVLNDSTASSSNKVAFDNQAEIIAVFSPQNNSTVGADAQVKVSALCEATANTAVLELSNGEIIDMNKDMAGMFSSIYTTKEADNGTINASVTITDLAGNTATQDPAISFEVDAVAPEISLNQIQEADVNQENATANLSGTIDEDGLIIEVYRILGNGKHILISDPSLISAGNSFSLTINLNQGLNSFYALSSDAVGNEGSSATVTYDYDNKGPIFTITVTSSGDDRNISVAASEDVKAGSLSYELRFDGNVQAFNLGEDIANRQWSGSFSPVDISSIDFVVEGDDLSGNHGIGIYTATNVIASQGATLENEDIVLLIPSDALGEDTPIEMSDTDEGTEELVNTGTNVTKTVDFRPDGTVFDQPVRITLPYDPNIYDTSKLKILYLNKTDPQNPYWEDMTDRIVEIDEVNHTITFETDHFSVYASASDTTPPELQITSPVNNSHETALAVAVTGSTEVNARGIDIEITVNGNPAASMTSTDGSFSLNINLEANQANTIEVSATDPANNSSTRTMTVIQESDTPVISISSSAATPTTDETVSISGIISPSSMQLVSWSSEAGNGSIDLQADGSFTIVNIPLQEGVNNIVITAISNSGKVSDETITITRLAGAPVVCASPTASPAAGTYSSAQAVSLSTTTAGASIYYTLDGSTPSTASTLYTAPINISSSKTIKAIAVKSGVSSSVATFAYTISTSSGGGGGGGGSTAVTRSVSQSGGTVSGYGATIDIPASAISGTARIKVEKVSSSGLALNNRVLLSEVFEIGKDVSGDFQKAVTITLPFNKTKLDNSKYDISLYYFNSSSKKWIELDNVKVDLATAKVSGEVDHFSKFAVLAAKKIEEEQPPVLSDIAGHWAEANINKLVSAEAITGYPDGSFKPNNTISRAEFATVLVKAYKLAAQSGKVFSDTSNHWAKTYIATAAANGIITGYNDTEFGPNDLITREQMAVMIVRAAKLNKATGVKTFKDNDDISSWAADAVSIASQHNIITGYPDNTFKAKENASRAEGVTVIVKALN